MVFNFTFLKACFLRTFSNLYLFLKYKFIIHADEEFCLRENWITSLQAPTVFYFNCLSFFYRKLPPVYQHHRFFFRSNNRGFGEDAFHTMWYLLLLEFKPRSFLEIGVYRGQVCSLVSLFSLNCGFSCDVYGISPFSALGDSVSTYKKEVDYFKDTVQNFAQFNLPVANFLQCPSTDRLAQNLIASRFWDMIYIDGNHDYSVAKNDWILCSKALKKGGVIILDDSSLYTNYEPPRYASSGHPGPSKVAGEIDTSVFTEILRVGHNRVFQRTS